MEMASALNETAALERSTVRRITIRLIPLLAVLYLINFIDRTNVAFAALRMREDIGVSPSAYGLGAGIFFIGYCLCEIPSNVALCRLGARRWISRILVSWGFVASLTALVQSSAQFIGLRFLLGIAEAGFYPGVIYYLSLWFPASHRARVTALFFGITAGSNAMNFFLPSVIQGFKSVSGTHLGLLTTGLLTAIPYAIASVAMVLWGRHSDHTRERRFHVGGAAIVAAAAIAFAFSLNSPVAILLGFSVMAAGIYSAINVFWSVPSGLFHGVSAAAAIGMINAIGNLSGFGGAYLVGSLFEKTNSYAPAFFTISCCVGLAGMGFIWLLRPRRKVTIGPVGS